MFFLSYAELLLFLFGIGKDEVVHLVGSKKDGVASQPDSVFTICGDTFNKATVKKESVWNVIQDSKVEINNTKDRVCRPHEPQKIVEVAKKKVGKIEYDALWQNCEHFAAFCRYDEAWSKKANTFLGMLLIFILITIAAMFYNTKNKIVFYTEKMMAFFNNSLGKKKENKES
nr:uncharacterized protein LOC117681093 [Crassostrea gigas]